MERVAVTGLLKIELPSYTLRLCDGGWIPWGAEKYVSQDARFGVLTALEPMEEGVGNEVPALELSFAPPSTSSPGDISQPGFQRSPAQFWIAEYNTETGVIVGTPELQFIGQVDLTTVRVSSGERTVDMSIVSTAEKLFEGNIGNTLSPTHHKMNNPGEKGHDNATGLKIAVAWGAASPNSGGSGGGGGGEARGFRDSLRAAR